MFCTWMLSLVQLLYIILLSRKNWAEIPPQTLEKGGGGGHVPRPLPRIFRPW